MIDLPNACKQCPVGPELMLKLIIDKLEMQFDKLSKIENRLEALEKQRDEEVNNAGVV